MATRDIRAGEEVLREAPAAFAANTSSNADDCHQMLAQMIMAGHTEEHGAATASLVCLRDEFLAKDRALLTELGRNATPVVQRLVSQAWALRQRAKKKKGSTAASVEGCGGGGARPPVVDETTIINTYARHMLNSMMVQKPESLSEVGMAIYPHQGALMNHSNSPNCWTLFQDVTTTSAPFGSGGDELLLEGGIPEGNTLVVRSLAPIKAGEEITIAYCDTAQCFSTLRATLKDQYFFDCGGVDERGVFGVGAAGKADPVQIALIVANKRYEGVSAAGAAAAGGGDGGGGGSSGSGSSGSASGGSACSGSGSRAAELDSFVSEPSLLVPSVTTALNKAIETGDWDTAYTASKDCLYLLRFAYRIFHPKVAPLLPVCLELNLP